MSFREHLLSRNYNPDLYKNQSIDDNNNLLSVHIYNLEDMMVGFQTYNPLGSKATFPRDAAKYNTYCMKGEKAFWGLETLDSSKSTLFIVEGLFKASALHKIGYNALSIFGSNASHLTDLLHSLNFELVAVGDNDEGGETLVKSVEKMGGFGFMLEKDVDEYTSTELIDILTELGF